MKSQLRKPARDRARYTEEYKKEALELRRNSFRWWKSIRRLKSLFNIKALRRDRSRRCSPSATLRPSRAQTIDRRAPRLWPVLLSSCNRHRSRRARQRLSVPSRALSQMRLVLLPILLLASRCDQFASSSPHRLSLSKLRRRLPAPALLIQPGNRRVRRRCSPSFLSPLVNARD